MSGNGQDHGLGKTPSVKQNLLLDAILLKELKGFEALQAWDSQVDIERLDPSSNKLLPFLYRHLEKHAVDYPHLKKLKGYYRYTWARNQILFDRITPVLKIFNEHQIKVMFLKGAASICVYYQDPGVRVLSDIDLMVPLNQAEQACNLLLAKGWRAQYPKLKVFSPLRNAGNLRLENGGEIDLHWHLFHQNCWPDADQGYWEQSVSGEFRGLPVYFLNPTDHLIHTCVHGTRGDSEVLNWILDAFYILQRHEKNIDWDLIISRAEQFNLVLPLKASLGFLADRFELPIPEHFLHILEGLPVTPLEVKAFQTHIRPLGFFGLIPSQWTIYSRSKERTMIASKVLGFPKYMKNWYGFDEYGPFISFLFSKTIGRFKQKKIQHAN